MARYLKQCRLLLNSYCDIRNSLSVGFGMDPDLQIDIITELDLVNTTLGVTQVSGLHNASKAFLFQDTEREIHAAPHVSEKLMQLFQNRSEFTFLATLQQKASTSGVILSIRELEHSYFELESSGLRDEIRFHYRFHGKMRTEVFPYRLADGQWHRIAVSLSASHLLLHVDCNRIYERVIDPPETNLTPESNLWLGQRNRKHGFFKVSDMKWHVRKEINNSQQGASNQLTIEQCDSDAANTFEDAPKKKKGLKKKITSFWMLNYAETRLSQLEDCHCEKTCQVNGLIYRDKDSWVEDDHCRNCTCKGGAVECRRMSCPPLECPPDALPVHVDSQCCKVCKGEYSTRLAALPPSPAPSLLHVPCILGHNFCAEGHRCGENSECKNWNTKATCECKNGYLSVQGDSAYCEDIDECAAKMHYCHANTVCVNLPGSYRCDCVAGYVRVDDFSCTEHDECGSGQHRCDENAICTNTIRGHSCTCKPGYVGNGTVCRAFCEEGCRYGGTCVAPNKCLCPSGFTGSHCEKDIDECAEGMIACHSHSRCVNLPGWYHCECRSGFHDNGSYSPAGESCVDIDECALKIHTCWNDSACVNLPGGFDCLCPSGPSCTGDCPHEGGFKRNGQVWTLREDRCSVCSCKDGSIFCRRTACDCGSPSADLFCCPECDTRVTSQCLHQSGQRLYRSGDNWTYSCQHCRCLEGEVDCWPLQCPALSCEYTAMSEGECCPHCVSDPCLADSITYDIRKTCPDGYGITRLSGAVWTMVGSPCTTCKCKNGNVCCSVDLECLNNN
uniref:Protein kinase C-binding protein NELL1 n=1 Tax=Junco hyemalis TaxID=40217 RepID=A0A8C5NSB9_JUNHY